MEILGKKEKFQMYYGNLKKASTIDTYYEFWTKVKKNIMDLGEKGIPSYFELHGKYI